MMEQTGKSATGTVMQIVRLKTSLSNDEAIRRARERAPQFEALPGLIQKYYAKLGPEGEYAGIYIWDSAESLKAFRESELAATIPQAYDVIGAPAVEIADIVFQLRE
ncbi:MAG: hypothetical protein KDC61_20140 [Saprospiraceae bacterium]|nr:hypothetical protein [Saprospiraceae bacterium]MCB9306122.1 hypothetical protein [Lewinellaceae bacterium]